jgi:hypothetical protein
MKTAAFQFLVFSEEVATLLHVSARISRARAETPQRNADGAGPRSFHASAVKNVLAELERPGRVFCRRSVRPRYGWFRDELFSAWATDLGR